MEIARHSQFSAQRPLPSALLPVQAAPNPPEREIPLPPPAKRTSAARRAAGSGTGRTDLNLRIGDAFSTVDPHNLSLNADISLSRQIYEPLYWINDEGEEIPMLATQYSVSEDGLTWTFTLRDGVTFHNGDPLKASDVVYSYERCFDNAYMQEKVEAIDSVTAPDDSTVEFHLKYQFSPLMEKIASIGIVSESFAEANKDEQGFLGFNACGTGAYTVKEAIQDVSITLEAYPDYWDGEAPIKTLNFELITDDTTAITAFEAGEIDAMNIPSANWQQISESGEVFHLFPAFQQRDLPDLQHGSGTVQ